MAQSKSFLQRPISWIAILGVGVAIFVATEPDKSNAASSIKPVSKKKAKVEKSGQQFAKEDYTATFKPVNDQPKNSFVPLVARRGGVGTGEGLANTIPADMTGGQLNWVYTGSAETDGVPIALIENRTTGDAVFLKRGERWKSAFVERITPFSVVMRGPSGTKTLGLVDDDVPASKSSVAQNGGFSPAQVDVPNALRGPIDQSGTNGRRRMNGLQALPDPAGALPSNSIGTPGQNNEN